MILGAPESDDEVVDVLGFEDPELDVAVLVDFGAAIGEVGE